ncbi:hypothetical protein V8E36_000948 [Tilletia maclaganii]
MVVPLMVWVERSARPRAPADPQPLSKKPRNQRSNNTISPTLAVLAPRHSNSTCYISSVLETLWYPFVGKRAEWIGLVPLMVKGGGIEALTLSMLEREKAYERKTDAAKKKGLQQALDIVVRWVVQREQLWGPGQYGNWTWVSHALQRETAFEVQSFFAVGIQVVRTCGFHGDRYETTKMTTSIDLSPNRAPSTASSPALSTFDGALTRYLAPHEAGLCRIKIVDTCGEVTTLRREVVSSPAILFFDLMEQDAQEELLELPEEIEFHGRAYSISGRICAASAAGMHFTSINRAFANERSSHRDGIYTYNDFDGHSKLLAALEPQPAPGALAQLTAKRQHALIVVYVLKGTGKGELGQLQNCTSSGTSSADSARTTFYPVSSSAGVRVLGVLSDAPQPASTTSGSK